MGSIQPRPRPWMNPKRKVILKDGDICNIRITDLGQGHYISAPFTSTLEACKALSVKPAASANIRIISIYSRKTISPLGITNPLLEHIFAKYNIHDDFADIVASFGSDPNRAEGSSNNATINVVDFEHRTMSYQIRYVEQNGRGGEDPWSLRHTGIYHHQCSNGVNVFVLLHPVREPGFQIFLFTLENDTVRRREFCANPDLLHTWLFDLYFDQWRWYLRDLGDRFAKENDLIMVVKPERADTDSSFARVQSLRNTKDLLLLSRACCAGNLDILSQLKSSGIEGLSAQKRLEAHETRMKGYIESAGVLKGRVQNSIDLVGFTLTLHNQIEAAKVDAELRDLAGGLKQLTEDLKGLTEDTVDNSSTVQIITFVSAVYLPGSFMATLFGMNFFMFNPDSMQLEISPDFWIFIVTWLPLTFVTGAVYMLIRRGNLLPRKRPGGSSIRGLMELKSYC